MSIKLVLGLGNSGAAYVDTRHNAGVILLKKAADCYGASFAYNKYCAAYTACAKIAGRPVLLAFADGFMNESGVGLGKILKFAKLSISETAVIHDDINLDIGRLKISCGGSPGGHNGVADIISRFGGGFARLRAGIGAKPDKRMDLADYVLGRMAESERAKLLEIDVAGCLETLVVKGVSEAQNVYNRAGASQTKKEI